MNPAIQFNRVTKIYESRQIAVADVSFQLPTGSTVGLLGANGSGKSTIMRLALGLISASAGGIEVLGKPMNPGSKSLRQRIGFLSDDPAFPKDLTAISYLRFVGNCFGLSRLERKARMGTLLRAVGLLEDAGRKIGTYSTGMKTRLGVAASLMNDPELLIWDEPTAGLDPISRGQTLELLETFRGKKTIVLSSHILGDIDRVCDRLLVLNQGQLLFDGLRADLENLLPECVLELRVSGAVGEFRKAACERLGRKDLCGEDGRLRFEMDAREPVGNVIEACLKVARETDSVVEGVNSTGRRLEDAYLKLITEDEFRGFLRANQS
ncbi:MAG: ABC transporter ATP-binding protein [Verrucomicrobia bacterium]|nr:ABC transporter ATP-binding protein [Verrucomicrobiota bacterium]